MPKKQRKFHLAEILNKIPRNSIEMLLKINTQKNALTKKDSEFTDHCEIDSTKQKVTLSKKEMQKIIRNSSVVRINSKPEIYRSSVSVEKRKKKKVWYSKLFNNICSSG